MTKKERRRIFCLEIDPEVEVDVSKDWDEVKRRRLFSILKNLSSRSR